MRFFASLGLALAVASGLALALASVASAQAAPSRETVREMLSGFEDAPSAEAFAALGSGAVAVLAAIHDDAAELPFLHVRALWAARFYRTDASRAFLRRALESDEGLALRMAIESLGAAFGEAEIARISPFLANDDVAVREGAIRTLASIDAPTATDALRARLSLEPDASLVTLLRASIAR